MLPLLDGGPDVDGVVGLTSRCLSSASSSLSSSLPNASSKSGFTCRARVPDDARDRKDGGGELGDSWISFGSSASSSKSSSSRAFT